MNEKRVEEKLKELQKQIEMLSKVVSEMNWNVHRHKKMIQDTQRAAYRTARGGSRYR